MAREKATQKFTNRLAEEVSPYLLQHAHDPVDWHPWGDEAFARAREEDKLIFLSIGYRCCHWCSVFHGESFEDEQTAEMLNRDFISIKVDREERPDVDDIYMKAVQMMTGAGGWPLSIFLTPDGRPFYGGTYFPPRAGFGRPSFRQVLQGVADAWHERRSEVLESAGKFTEALARVATVRPEQDLCPDVLHNAFETMSSYFDDLHGGFGNAPKFPQPTMLVALLHHWHRTGEPEALAMVEKTLTAMADGGIRDHLAGGFHRYSTDAQWLVPHFEKMLYDQALLGRLYAQAHQITGTCRYAVVARDIFDYVLHDMTDPAGGFYAAEDADSEGREGAFYVWRKDEIQQVLADSDADLFCAAYGVTDQGNFENEENVLHLAASTDALSRRFEKTPEQIEALLADARLRLLDRRNTRPRPARDDKMIAGWNGLMISALAYGGAILAEPRYTQAAARAAVYCLDALRQGDRLMRYGRNGRAIEKAFLEDYAFLILGLIDLYEATFEVEWLREARHLAARMIDLFADEEAGGFFMSGADAERLIQRDKPAYDGAVPSGNSVAAIVLLRLGRILTDDRFTAEGERVLRRFSGQMADSPVAHTAMLLALDYRLGPSQEIVITGNESDAGPLIREARAHFLPNATILRRTPATDADALAELVPFTKDLPPLDDRPAAYVCENYTCHQPVTTPEALRAILASPQRHREHGE